MPKSIEYLEEENAQLKSLLKMERSITDLGNLSAGLNITKQQAEILLLLYQAKNSWLNRERLEVALINAKYNPKAIEVQISHIRKKIGKECIDTIRNIGYKLTDVGVAKCRKVLDPTPFDELGYHGPKDRDRI